MDALEFVATMISKSWITGEPTADLQLSSLLISLHVDSESETETDEVIVNFKGWRMLCKDYT